MINQHGTLEISESRLRHNLELLGRKLPAETIICATTKAGAYGHGTSKILQLLLGAGVSWFCLYSLREADGPTILAVGWQKAGLTKVSPNFLILAPVCATNGHLNLQEHELSVIINTQARVNIVDVETARLLENLATSRAIASPIRVHVQVDTGLTRSGISVTNAPELLREIVTFRHLLLEGIFTHLSHGDEAGHSSIAEQIAALHRVADPIKRECPNILIHAQNSGGTWNFSDASLDMVRIGIAMYGLQPSLDDPIPGLLPIARLVAPILMIHERPANTGVGYGHTFTTQRASRLAIVPVGYADGYPRAMSNRGVVQVRGQHVPVVGRVSMDQIIVDVTDVAGATVGDQVTVFSDDPVAVNCIDQVAKACGTIGYEIATGLGARLMRRVVG